MDYTFTKFRPCLPKGRHSFYAWKDSTEIAERIGKVLSKVGMKTKGFKFPHELSGGEQQRVAIARAMVKKPKLVLADEPTANLDSDNSHHILKTMEKLNSDLNTTFIFATHDDKVIKYLRRKIILKDGKVTSDTTITN